MKIITIPTTTTVSRNSFKPISSHSGLHDDTYSNRAFAIFIFCIISLFLITPTQSSANAPDHANIQAKRVNSPPGANRKKPKKTKKWEKGRIMVMPRAGLPAKAFSKILAEHDGKAKKIGQSNLYIVDLPAYTEEGTLARLAHHPHLKFAELDYEFQPSLVPNDQYYGNAWHLPKINAPAAWDYSQGNSVTIAILDTGIEDAHPDLAGRMVPGWNFYDNNADTTDVHGHGTVVAGAAAASTNNSIGVAGLAGDAMIMPVRIASPQGYASGSTIAQGLIWAADNGARVANISYAGVPASSTIISASEYMKSKNGLVIVAAGNDGINEGYTPTGTMIPVSATDRNDNLTNWSSYGNYVAMSAPGVDIWSTFQNAAYGYAWGTSLASPVVAGTVAVMMAANPSMQNTDIEAALFSTAVDLGANGRDAFYGYGRVDAGAAVELVNTNPDPDPDPTDEEVPTVSIVDPVGGETVSDLVPVDIDAFDNVGVTETELWVGNTKVAIDTTEPFAFTWDSNGSVNGPTHLVVRAIDAAGNVANSDTVTVNVDNSETPPPSNDDTEPPVIQIVNPVPGNVSGRVTITVNASDNNGSSGIALSIYVDNKIISNGTGSTLSTKWNTRPKRIKKGLHVIDVVAVDAAGNTSTVSVTVNVVK